MANEEKEVKTSNASNGISALTAAMLVIAALIIGALAVLVFWNGKTDELITKMDTRITAFEQKTETKTDEIDKDIANKYKELLSLIDDTETDLQAKINAVSGNLSSTKHAFYNKLSQLRQKVDNNYNELVASDNALYSEIAHIRSVELVNLSNELKTIISDTAADLQGQIDDTNTRVTDEVDRLDAKNRAQDRTVWQLSRSVDRRFENTHNRITRVSDRLNDRITTEVDRIDSVNQSQQNQIDRLISKVREHAGLITDLTARVATNEDDIAQNAAGIAQNVTDIANISAELTDLTARVATNEDDIAQNAAGIAQNVTDIANLSAELTDLTARVATNEDDIAQNVADIANLTTELAELADKVSANSVKIEIMAGRIETIETFISGLEGQVNAWISDYIINNGDAIDERTRGVIATYLNNGGRIAIEGTIASYLSNSGLTDTSDVNGLINTFWNNSGQAGINSSMQTSIEQLQNSNYQTSEQVQNAIDNAISIQSGNILSYSDIVTALMDDTVFINYIISQMP